MGDPAKGDHFVSRNLRMISYDANQLTRNAHGMVYQHVLNRVQFRQKLFEGKMKCNFDERLEVKTQVIRLLNFD